MSTASARRKALAKRRASAPSTVGANPALRTLTEVKPSGLGIRRHRASMTGAQRNSEGRRSEWSASPYYFTDPKWSATAYSNKAV